ncbi:MAG: biopolymer transporter ExbD [Bacteroidales bacterium]|nr:biopolymer transporter ExbD [Bacteroidales bacterium]MDE6238158.1 biopolymer transporter ExbD [Muribaculaceae bacterium]MDE6537109.1 biopolymer transporter ExbD [Muribaculaceae bacterium]
MAEIQQNDAGGGKKGRQKKMAIRVDFTPMVDMNMLLITFFMLCTTMIKSQTLTIALPTNEKIENKENLNQASADDAVTIILDAKRKANSSEVDTVNGKVVPVVYYYEGKPGGDGGMIGNDGSILSQNNNLKESEFLSSDARTGTARGIRQLIQNRNKQVLEKINALKKKYEEGGFGSLETKDGREKAQEAYNKAASEVRKDSTLSKPVIIIKSTPNASYESLINILDEMQINSIAKYQIDNMTQIDSLMVLDHRGMLKK